MKKIGIIIQMLSGGGAERCAANMSIDLSKKYDVHLIVFDCTKTTYKYGGTLHDLSAPASNNKIKRIFTLARRVSQVRKIKKEQKFDTVISLMEGANLVNVLSRQGETVIVSERNLISFFVKSRLHVFLEKYILERADRIVALSNVVKEDLVKVFSVNPNKINTIYNSVDIEKFQQDNIIYSSENCEEMPKFVTMGRLTSQKAQWHIFRAFCEVVKKYPLAKLTVLGQGEMLDEYIVFLKKLGISEKVELKGFMPNPHNYIKESDIFVFSSMVEGLGNVILEALACGKPVISTDCDAGPREILSPSSNPNKKTETVEYADYGVLVPTTKNDRFDPNDLTLSKEELILATAMLELIRNKELRNKYERQSKIRAYDFSPEQITRNWENLIEKNY